jgi:hypothetical protein
MMDRSNARLREAAVGKEELVTVEAYKCVVVTSLTTEDIEEEI